MEVVEANLASIGKRLRAGKEKLCVVGLGRMGLPTACLFADAGVEVIGVDTNLQQLKFIASGKAPFQEPGLQSLMEKVVKNGKLKVKMNLKQAIPYCRVVILIVPTMIDSRKRPDYSMMEKACKDVGLNLTRDTLVILESTVGPGFTENTAREILEKNSGLKAREGFWLAYSPIRASSGQILRDLADYPRLVAGIDEASLEGACSVLSLIVKGRIIRMENIRSVEATKVFENIYRDTNIALANTLAKFCEEAELNYEKIAEAANSQPYCHLHRPGIVGGKCIPVNPYFLIHEAKGMGVDTQFWALARKINDGMARHIVRTVAELLRECGKGLRRANVLILGASFKPNVKEDHITPTRSLTDTLEKRGAKVTVWDPLYTTEEIREQGYTPAILDTEQRVDCIIISVGHSIFMEMKSKILETLKPRKKVAILDCSGLGIFTPSDSTEKVICVALGNRRT